MDRQMELWRMTEVRHERGGGGDDKGTKRTRNKMEMKEE